MKAANELVLFVLLFLVTSCPAYNQTQSVNLNANEIFRIIPSSPTASSLGKYGDWPVSYFTGTPNIAIPLYEIKAGKLSLPITVSYHATGVKVEEVPSWVGAGWSLNAGGAITRTVFGAADENKDIFPNIKIKGKYLPASFDIQTNDNQYDIFTKLIGELGIGQYDSEPDIFFFNFAGKTGKFFIDEDGNFHAIPFNTLKIRVHPVTVNTPIEQRYWEIVDEEGTIYILGQNQQGTESVTSTIYPPPMFLPTPYHGPVTTWYLNKIISADRADTIYFEYSTKTERYNKKAQQSFRVAQQSLGSGSQQSYGYGYNENVKSGTKIGTDAISYSGNSQLKTIYWKGGQAKFYANTQRADIFGVALDSIEITDQNSTIIKFYSFDYTNDAKRLFLNKITEKGNDGTSIPPHSFTYNNGLPDRYSDDQDYWGYFNNAGNTYLLPYESVFDQFYYTTSLGGAPHANRDPNESAMQAGTLKLITYPTGGYTQFEFEANRYYETGDNQYLSTINKPGSYVQTSVILEALDTTLFPNPANPRVKDFFIDQTQFINLPIDFKNYRKGAGSRDSWLASIKLEKINGDGSVAAVILNYNAFDNFDDANAVKTFDPVLGVVQIHFDINNIQLLPGQYRITAALTCLKGAGGCGNPTPATSVKAVMNYRAYVPPSPTVENSMMCGGLRIKKITNYDRQGVPSNERSFDYQTTATVSGQQVIVSSGTMLSKPKFTYISNQPYAPFSNEGCYLCFHSIICNSTAYDLSINGISQGPHIGYSTVKENFKGGENGYNLYTYTMYNDQFNDPVFDAVTYGNYSRPVFLPATSNEYKRGLLKSINTFKKYNSGYLPVKDIINEYNYNDNPGDPNYYSLKILKVKRISDSLGGVSCSMSGTNCGPLFSDATKRAFRSKEFAYGFYYLTSAWIQQTKKTEKLYDKDGQNPISQVTNYYYNNPNHAQLTKTETFNSKGEKIISNFKYPLDYTISGTASNNTAKGIQNLQNKNVVSPVIEQFIQKANPDGSNLRTVSSTFISYKATIPYPDVISRTENNQGLTDFVPAYITASTATIDTRYQPKISFDTYDANGNILQQHKSRDINHSYLWGYQNTYPIAEAVNALSNEIFFSSFEEKGWDAKMQYDNFLSHSGRRSGKIVKTTAGELISYSTTWLSISLSAIKKFHYSGWIFSNGPSAQIYLLMKRAGETGLYSYIDYVQTVTTNKWVYIEKDFDVPADVVKLNIRLDNNGGGTVWFDDVRLHPSNAQMTTYSYDPLVGITSQCDINNRTTYYEYDSFGRLKLILDQDKNILKKSVIIMQGSLFPVVCLNRQQESNAFLKLTEFNLIFSER